MFNKGKPEGVPQLLGYYTAQPPGESLFQGARKEASANRQNLHSGGALQAVEQWPKSSSLQDFWRESYHVLLNQSESRVGRVSVQVEHISSGYWTLLELLLVSNSVFDVMDRILRYSQGEECIHFENLGKASLLFVDDVILLSSLEHDLQH